MRNNFDCPPVADLDDLKAQFVSLPLDGMPWRGAPFWAWNDDLDPAELRRQVRAMHAAGLGGFFMHARIGLMTPYLSAAWMNCIRACVDEAGQLGMGAWLYDEDCWPSGTAGGRVPARGPAMLQKRLQMAVGDAVPETPDAIAWYHVRGADGELHSCHRVAAGTPPDAGEQLCCVYSVATAYVDLLSPDVTAAFIEEDYEPYADAVGAEFGGTIPGMFTDEPQLARPPWSPFLAARFQELTGRDIDDVLPSLFFSRPGAGRDRYDFWRTVTSLFRDSFSRRIGAWCDRHGLIFTGHVMAEDSLASQTGAVGATMAHYPFFGMPGIDHLGRRVHDPLLTKQCSSIARQTGGRRVLSEMFGGCGWGVSFDRLRLLAESQFVRGIDFVCQHLSLYSLRGCRKRDYPPSLHVQQPYWRDYRILNDYFARLLRVLTTGEPDRRVLMLHPISSAWEQFGAVADPGLADIQSRLTQVSRWLLESLIDFDFGDEMFLAEQGRVENAELRVGTATYSVVVLPCNPNLAAPTAQLLADFACGGGTVIAIDALPERVDGLPAAPLTADLPGVYVVGCDHGELVAAVSEVAEPSLQISIAGNGIATGIEGQVRRLHGRTIAYLVNLGDEDNDAVTVSLAGTGSLELWDCRTGDIIPLPSRTDGRRTWTCLPFRAGTSHLLSLDSDSGPGDFEIETVEELQPEVVPLGGGPTQDATDWKLELLDPNAITLDYCRYRMDDNDWSEPLPVIRLQELLHARDRSGRLQQRFELQIEAGCDTASIRLVVEDLGRHRVWINGRMVDISNPGRWLDLAFETVDVGAFLRTGVNEIVLERDFLADSDVQRDLDTGEIHESSRNRFHVAVELESIYLIGNFGVYSASPWRPGPHGSVATDGPFRLATLPDACSGTALEQCGLPFFAGTVRLTRTVEFADASAPSLRLLVPDPDAIVLRASVDGADAGVHAWPPYEFELADHVEGDAFELSLELSNSCRNLLGPHHHIDGDPPMVGPGTFQGRKSWTDRGDAEDDTWSDTYHMTPFGLKDRPVVELRESLRPRLWHTAAQDLSRGVDR